MADALGFDSGDAGSMAYKLLTDLLARRHADAVLDFQKAEAESRGREGAATLNERSREADMTNARDTAAEAGMNARYNLGQQNEMSRFDQQRPLRIAQTASENAQTAHTNFEMDPQRVLDRIRETGAAAAAQGSQARQTEQMRENYETKKPMIFQSVDGTGARSARLSNDGSQYVDVPMPAGLAPKGAPIAALKGADANAANQYDSVIREGSKILNDLKASGLDTDNNPLNARARNLIATKLKVATNDPRVDALIQNLGYLQTQALKAAGQGQRLTQPLMDIFSPHIASPDSTGARIASVLPEMLRQASTARSQIYLNSHIPDPGILQDTQGNFLQGYGPTRINRLGAESGGSAFDWVPGKGLVPRGK